VDKFQHVAETVEGRVGVQEEKELDADSEEPPKKESDAKSRAANGKMALHAVVGRLDILFHTGRLVVLIVVPHWHYSPNGTIDWIYQTLYL
jgi:hypothetical protein